jgi:hypothetical protein
MHKSPITRSRDGENITVNVPYGFSGRLLLNIGNGELKKQTDIPQNYIFGSFDSLVELMRDAGYCVNPPAEMPDNKG